MKQKYLLFIFKNLRIVIFNKYNKILFKICICFKTYNKMLTIITTIEI